MAAVQRGVVYKDSHHAGSVGSAEDDSMTGSDGSGSPSSSIMDFHGQPAQILLQYDTSTGTFTDPGLIKPQVMRRDKRPYPSTFDALNHLTSFGSPDQLVEANPVLIRAISSMNSSSSAHSRRQRSEKKPIPSEQKDDKYFERRRRNNYAAKKSRDYRKAREDEIAMRAVYLEKENAVLKAQLTTLRDEAEALKNMLLQKRQQQHQHQNASLSRFIGQLTHLPAHMQA